MIKSFFDGNVHPAWYIPLSRGIVRVAGRDRLAFLHGQLSNDVLSLQPGEGIRACLLNNTGHLLADIIVHAFDGHVFLETDPSQAPILLRALDRFIIREKVLLEDVSASWQIVTLQGPGARDAWERLDSTPLTVADGPLYAHAPLPFTAADGSAHGEIARRPRIGAPDGYDLWLPVSIAAEIIAALSANPGVAELDDSTYETLRIESAEPAWGAELTEAVIPLEAGLLDAISFTKGCYMGQEIIARIHSRGHTNRTLRRLTLAAPANPADKIVAVGGPKNGEEVGWLTSTATSPRLGPIALAYIRNEYAAAGSTVKVNEAGATVDG
ncbi:MAG TPA: glycine cleavage T C-terminal barrel domain-containing protein [Capsulimonadaceae bacterium]|jgi:folate-binding protein YgfZ